MHAIFRPTQTSIHTHTHTRTQTHRQTASPPTKRGGVVTTHTHTLICFFHIPLYSLFRTHKYWDTHAHGLSRSLPPSLPPSLTHTHTQTHTHTVTAALTCHTSRAA